MKAAIKIYILFCFIILLIVFIKPNKQQDEIITPTETIEVIVSGAVFYPGKKVVSKEMTIGELLSLAKILKGEADISSFNLADYLIENKTYHIPFILSKEQSEQTGKVNLNYATKEELMTLPGIGEAKALEIIEYRSKYGLFKTILEIMNISGIKEATYEKIKDFITV